MLAFIAFVTVAAFTIYDPQAIAIARAQDRMAAAALKSAEIKKALEESEAAYAAAKKDWEIAVGIATAEPQPEHAAAPVAVDNSAKPISKLGSMDIPKIVRFATKNDKNGNLIEARTMQDVRYLVFHHFAFVPNDLNIQDFSNTSQRLYGKKPFTTHRVMYEGDNDYRDTFVPYHYVIHRQNGKIIWRKMLDPETMCSAHDGLHDGSEYKCNSISVAIAGDYRDTPYEPELIAVMEDLTRELAKHYPIEKVLGHKDIDATACPGKYWGESQPRLQALIKPPVANILTMQVSRYYTPRIDQAYFFRNPQGQWAGKFYPADDAERQAAFDQDFKINCQGDCLQGKYGRMREGAAACPKGWKAHTRFRMAGKEYECLDVGSAITDGRLDIWAGEGNAGLNGMATIPSGTQTIQMI